MKADQARHIGTRYLLGLGGVFCPWMKILEFHPCCCARTEIQEDILEAIGIYPEIPDITKFCPESPRSCRSVIDSVR